MQRVSCTHDTLDEGSFALQSNRRNHWGRYFPRIPQGRIPSARLTNVLLLIYFERSANLKVAFATLGCKVNQYETEALRELFAAAGHELVPFGTDADAVIVNTCTVTAMSDKKSRQLLSRAHCTAPDALVVAVGCYAETARETVAALPGVALVVGTEGRRELVRLCESALAARRRGEALPPAPVTPPPFERRCFEELSAIHDDRTRATLKIQDGCVNFCSYCAIPFARGALRSRSLESCRRELDALAAEGCAEVVLTGIQLGAYGKEPNGKGELADVIRLAQAAGLPRIRLGSLEPVAVTENFLQTLTDCPALCPQFHLSLQSGSDAVLKRMNRRYDTAGYRGACAALRQLIPNCALTTDLIAGFPAETEAEHGETMDFVRELGFARLHVFPYSRRDGTKAAAMAGQLSRAVKEARTKELIALGERLATAYADSLPGIREELLVETDGAGYLKRYLQARPVDASGKPLQLPEGSLVSGEVQRGADGGLVLRLADIP